MTSVLLGMYERYQQEQRSEADQHAPEHPDRRDDGAHGADAQHENLSETSGWIVLSHEC